ncbi:phosphatase PAP2 family protein [bacterium 210917-DFI.7.65]|nr:phosphatase PAP2 family protein [Clostridiales bacterium]MCB6899050.1 phosphatase PAP2 family protein [bacterium 210917-DFI.7.65]
MTSERYEKLVAPLRRHPRAVAALAGVNQALTALCYTVYPLLLLFLLGERDARFWRCLLVPAVSFAAVTLFRSACNAPRPYEQGIDALLKKKRTGHSFPSRHVFSAVMIAVTAAYLLPALSVPLFVAAALLALIRVLGGIHYPRDVFCGALFALIAGGIGFWLIP